MFRRWECVVVSTRKRYILWAFRRGINDVNADVTNKLILSSGLQHKPCFKCCTRYVCVCAFRLVSCVHQKRVFSAIVVAGAVVVSIR